MLGLVVGVLGWWVESKPPRGQCLAWEKGKKKERSWLQGEEGPLLPLRGLCMRPCVKKMGGGQRP